MTKFSFHEIELYDFFDDKTGLEIKDFNQRRAYFRKKLALIFLEEQVGAGKEEKATRYRYFVEQTANDKIYLQRPALLNKGFDFSVCFENKRCLSKSGKRYIKTPTHDYIGNILQTALHDNKECKKFVNCYFNIEPLANNQLANPFISEEIELACKAAKWLFMEQDFAYWNYSGRQMFYDEKLKH